MSYLYLSQNGSAEQKQYIYLCITKRLLFYYFIITTSLISAQTKLLNLENLKFCADFPI